MDLPAGKVSGDAKESFSPDKHAHQNPACPPDEGRPRRGEFLLEAEALAQRFDQLDRLLIKLHAALDESPAENHN